MPLQHSPEGNDVSSSPSATNARWIEEPTLAGDRRDDDGCLSLVLVRCAPPQEILEHAAMSELTPPPHAALSSWSAYWSGDERYTLRGQRWDGGVEWYVVALAPSAASAAGAAGEPARAAVHDEAPVCSRRARTALVGWRPYGSRGAARWTVAWRRS